MQFLIRVIRVRQGFPAAVGSRGFPAAVGNRGCRKGESSRILYIYRMTVKHT